MEGIPAMRRDFSSVCGLTSKRIQLGKLLIQKGLITEEQLKEALEYQRKSGGKIGWILASLGYISRIELYKALAEHFNLPFILGVENIVSQIDVNFLKKFDRNELLKKEILPASIDVRNKIVKIFTSNPCSIELKRFVEKYFEGFDLDIVVITDLDLARTIESIYRDLIIESSVKGLLYVTPRYSASQVFSKGQVFAMGIVFFSFLAGLYFNPVATLVVVIALVQIFYILSIGFKLILSIAGAKSEMVKYVTEEEVKAFQDKDLPVYTILVPLYREPEVVGILIESLKKMDYPQHKLDVILLFEEDDKETLEAAKACKPPANWRFIIVPDSIPKTKPKACNYGLFFAKGKYLTIYDAEDIPEPDQLKKAVIAFNKGKGEYLCFQAALNYYNRNENFLTKMFTLEYSYWFDYLLPGLYNLGLPIPLGGTSNHFDVEKLRIIEGWDPYNTTEDADLGVRAFEKGYKVGIINSTTYEEANARLKNWIRQRSRWIKGYMQTFLVHSRNLGRLYRNVGLKGTLSFLFLVGGTPATFLINPIMWFMFIVWLITQTKLYEPLFPGIVLHISLFNLLIGNFMGIYLNMLAVFKRGYYELLPYAFLNPIYWMLHSIASYIALYELFTKPFYWRKTQHGISKYKPPVVNS